MVVRARISRQVNTVARRHGHTQASTSQQPREPLDPWNCLTHRAAPSSSKAAAGSDAAPTPSSSSSRLTDWPITVKDNFCTSDMPTTCASKMLADYQPTFDAAVVARLKAAGARIVGKTNLDEFAMGSSNAHSYFGPVKNPARQTKKEGEQRAAGGSSGGAAASVRAGLCRVAIGSDTGGSIRLPASHCGVWGFKPSYGLISRWGLVSYADSLDTVGIAASSWQDARQAFQVLSGHDRRDPTSMHPRTRSKAAEAAREQCRRVRGSSSSSPLEGLRVGIPQECFPAELQGGVLPPFERLVDFLSSRGATVVPCSLPKTSLALSAYYVIATAEASSNLARYDGIRYGFQAGDEGKSASGLSAAALYARTRTQGFGREVQKRLLLGAHALSAGAFDNTFLRSQEIRKVVQRDYDAVFRAPNVLRRSSGTEDNADGVDVVVHPCSVSSAPRLDASASSPSSSMHEYVQDLLTVPSSLAGLPSVSMPTGVSEDDGWPVGTMLTAQWGMEDVLDVVASVVDAEYEPNGGLR